MGISQVASHVHVAGGRRNAFSQRFLNDMQIARHVLFGVNEKNAMCFGSNVFKTIDEIQMLAEKRAAQLQREQIRKDEEQA